ncbi:hypothetical protein SNOG_13964 [Parastagonospora nodorum SN15]|uniref:Uncharacterized protein n=1 Tax=Phaeosphaeria nodorum (strain SN15 / ATCC MYA-4574 / FGSC 10173) TaxID=321614 RepID=Q0U2U1_PHANO|nr:hypothetical protein SNOG_13964 [Parastagonospora nodorum SN15]EAT78589.1 hypothetical protein SNOG_13964 [Parastagonospora nodorum SN15]
MSRPNIPPSNPHANHNDANPNHPKSKLTAWLDCVYVATKANYPFYAALDLLRKDLGKFRRVAEINGTELLMIHTFNPTSIFA